MTEERMLAKSACQVPHDDLLDGPKSNIAQACTDTLHGLLRDIEKYVNELQHMHAKREGLAYWVHEHATGAHQLANFLRTLGGDQQRFWRDFVYHAKKLYGMLPVDTNRILDGKFHECVNMKPSISAVDVAREYMLLRGEEPKQKSGPAA